MSTGVTEEVEITNVAGLLMRIRLIEVMDEEREKQLSHQLWNY
jgi:hypothetical protein